MKKWKWMMPSFAAALTVALFAFAYAAEDDDDDNDSEESVAFASLPEAVRKAAEAYFGTTEGLEAEKEIEDGVLVYCVEGNKDGGETEIELTESGEIVEIEQETEFARLPQAVQDRLRREYPGAQFGEVEAKQIRYYEVKLKTSDGTRDVRAFASGRIEDAKARKTVAASN